MQHSLINSSIKIVNHFIILLVFAIIFTGCKKENVGCPAGFSGPNCETRDLCYNVTCLNGGSCDNGHCNCPIGFTGTNCGTALPLLSVTITRIIVNKYPTSTNIGQVAYYWDPGTTSSKYPDIYINIKEGTASSPSQTSAVYNNVNSVPQTYPLVPLTLNHPSSNYAIGLYDNDTSPDADDFMGGIYFKPADHKAGYPQTIHLSNAAAKIDYTVYIIWNF